MTRTKPLAAALAALLIVTSVGAARAASEQSVHGRAYLFYGLIAMIDWGMDQLAARINRTGVLATTNSHMSWRSVADQAIADYRRDPKPISVVGHSAGGDSAVAFADALAAARVPVALLITYDPNRTAGSIPANVERYIDLYQSSNILGGGDPPPGRGFHGHYAAFNLKDRPEIIHVNMDKFEGIQAQLAAKIRSAAAGGAGEAVPLHLVFPSSGPIELWDSGVAVQARGGDTVQSLAAAYHVPAWAVAQINQKPENAPLSEGQRVVIPRMLGQRLAVRGEPTESAKPESARPESATPESATPESATPEPAKPERPKSSSSALPSASPGDITGTAPAAASSAPSEASSSAPSQQAATPEPSQTTSPASIPASAPAAKPAPNAGANASQINQ